MSEPPQPSGLLLTNRKSFAFRCALGHTSVKGLFTAPKLTGSPQPPSAVRSEYQMSMLDAVPPGTGVLPGRFDAK
ncbi:MAG: hypothetical protein ACRDLU_04895 [Gaiellaceae bacterium]